MRLIRGPGIAFRVSAVGLLGDDMIKYILLILLIPQIALAWTITASTGDNGSIDPLGAVIVEEAASNVLMRYGNIR